MTNIHNLAGEIVRLAPELARDTANSQHAVEQLLKPVFAERLKWIQVAERLADVPRSVVAKCESGQMRSRETLALSRQVLDELERAKAGPPSPLSAQPWQVVVQRPDYERGLPGYVQVDDLADGPGTSRWSKSPAQLKAEGWSLPDFSRLPTGRYPLERALRMLESEVDASEENS